MKKPSTKPTTTPNPTPDSAQPQSNPAQSQSTPPDHKDTQIAELIADLQRTRADFENFRKNVEKDRETAKKLARESTVAKFLPLLDDLDRATVAPAAKEEEELNNFARERLRLAGGLRPWDRAFAAERLREAKYAYSEAELKRNFEFAAVLEGLFRMTKFLFGVEVRELKGASRPSVWHRDVRFFEVRRAGRAIAHFYLDPWVRSGLKQGGAWMNEFRNRSRRGRRLETPLAVVCTNFPKPDRKGRSFLPMWRPSSTSSATRSSACSPASTSATPPASASSSGTRWRLRASSWRTGASTSVPASASTRR